MIFLPISILFLIFLFIFLFIFLIFFIQFEVVKIALTKLGLPPIMAIVILIASIIGSSINIPIHSKEVYTPVRQVQPFSFFAPWKVPPIENKQVLAVNVGGCLIPLLLVLYVFIKAPVWPTIFATVISVLICHRLAHVVPGMGVVLSAFIPPVISVILAFMFSFKNRVPVAFISGVLGVLIGADLLNISNLGNYPGIMSIGGAGVYDGIFLVGIISAFLA
ncbi:MAG: DUF1614 domain-containing protein [Candidatus Omnitrophica bacterium]|nr:DUF1614 domain-containing protein [Candidatus Omnitrophota bacterium]